MRAVMSGSRSPERVGPKDDHGSRQLKQYTFGQGTINYISCRDRSAAKTISGGTEHIYA